jgi:hypothetical protein
MAQNDNKISNVIGTHIPNWLLEQLKTRSKKGTQTNRDNANLQYLGNKTGWVRLVSSININAQTDTKYFQELTGLTLSKPEDLAKNFVLYGGVSKYNNQNGKTTYTLRKGFKETYSLLGDQEVQDFGYRPMPGLTRVVVETQGRLGSVRSATIEFKVWDIKQLDVIDALYFKLGYTMFLEWGNTFYYESNSEQLKASELFSLNPFEDKLTKEQITLNLGKNRRESQGNYDGMLGMVSNFSFSYNQEGGYDCVLKLVGLGSLADTIKINQPATLPGVLKEQIDQLSSIYAQIQRQAEQAAIDAKAKEAEKIKKAEEKKREDEINANFKSYIDFLTDDNKNVENLSASPATVTNSFFKSYAIAPSSLVTSNDKTKDYNSRLDYDYYYSSENKLYIKKLGVILNGREDLSKVVSGIQLYGPTCSKALLGRSPQQVAASAITVETDKKYSIQTQYFSDSSHVTQDNYSGFTPYNFTIDVEFPTQNPVTGNIVNYGLSKEIMLQDIASFFLAQPVVYGKMLIPKVSLPSGGNSTVLSSTLKKANGEYTAGFLTSDRYSSAEVVLSTEGFYALVLNYTYQLSVNFNKKEQQRQADGSYIQVDVAKTAGLPVSVRVRITDSALINSIGLANPNQSTREYQKYLDSLNKQNTGTAPAENTAPVSNTSTEQTKPAVQYQSSLEATLRAVQIYSLVQAIDASSKKIDLDRKVRSVSLLSDSNFMNKVFKDADGLFSPYITQIINKTLNDSDINEKNVKYGYNAAVLSNKGLTPSPVNYEELLKGYVLPYDINQDINDGTRLAHPVYIPFGFLLFILNHTCTLYDRKKDQNKAMTPLVYIDYNPESNFCLSHPCQMTTNGLTFMIPFQGTFSDYKQLFYEEVLEGNNIKGTEENKNQTTSLFNPEKDDSISGDIPAFKGLEKIDTYRGKIMNVLVNIDYVFDIIKQFFSQDETNSVFLKAFVEQLLTDMNKTLGNFNIFRIAYDDTANCLQIVDDQLVPSLDNEEMLPKNSDFDIPVFGKGSIARSLDLKTELSTKVGSMLAISANSDINKKSASSVDGTPFGFINANYEDRYIPNRAEQVDITREKDILKIKGKKIDSVISSALRFNKNVQNFYSTYNPSTENVSHAINYFIEKLNKNKLDAPTRAAAMIPVSVNFTLDGVSGFNMMQGFTITDKFLPYTYGIRKTYENEAASSRKVGFMVTGNVHTIENNEWTTAIKANMTYLKARGEFETRTLNTSLRKGAQASFNPEGTNPDRMLGVSIAGNTYPTVSSGYRNVRFTNIGLGTPAADKVNPTLLSDISTAAVNAGVTVEVTTAVSGHTSSPSRHNSGNAVDIAIINGQAVSTNSSIKSTVDSFVSQLIALGYNKNAEGSSNPKAVLTFGFKDHDDHVHVSNLQA